jgi:hypothetical protein
MQIKIENTIFNCSDDSSVQLSFGSHATLNLKFDLNINKNYESYFIKLYETDTVFKIVSSGFESNGCRIKTLDIDYISKKMEISIHSDILETKDISIRREEVINELLQKTFKDSEDIK